MANNSTLNTQINVTANTTQATQQLNNTTQATQQNTQATNTNSQATATNTRAHRVNAQAVSENGGAMGLLNEITGGLAMTFKDAGEAIALAGLNLRTFSGIIAATGIGALILILTYWEDIADAIGLSNKEAERFLKLQEEAANAAIQRSTQLNVAILNLNRALQGVNFGNYEAAFAQLQKIIPELSKFKITDPKDFGAIQSIVNEFRKLINIQELQKANEKELVTLRQEAAKEFGPERQLRFTDAQLKQAKEMLALRNEDANAQERLVNYLEKTGQAQKGIFGGTIRNNYEVLESNIAINERERELLDLKQKETIIQSQINNLVGVKVFLLEKEEKARKKAEEDAKKAEAEAEKARQLKLKRLEALAKIREQIENATESLREQVNLTDPEKYAKGLNAQYVELTNIYNERNKLLELEKQAIALGLTEEETKDLNAQIKAYDELIKQRSNQILQSPLSDENSERRLEVIRLNGEAELMAIQGFAYEALRIRQEAFNIEAAMREKVLSDQLAKEKTLLQEAQETYTSIEGSKTEEKAKALAVVNDLIKKSNETENLLNEERLGNDMDYIGMSVEAEKMLLDTKTELNQQYADTIQIISQNLQGFLGLLQNEQIIKSKDARNALLVIEKGLAIADVWISEARSSAQAKDNLAATPVAIGGVPNPMFPIQAAFTAKSIVANKVNAAVATASILAQTLASWNRSSGGSGGSSGGAGAANPQAQFNIVGSSGNNQLAAAIAAQQNQPVNAYVVGTDVTTQQALDRNRITTATFL